jgi:hypothetical protein
MVNIILGLFGLTKQQVFDALKPLLLPIIALIIFFISMLIFMANNDFNISCQTYSIDSGITCPLNK